MNNIVTAITEAFKSLFQPRMLALVLWPMLVAVVIWVTAALFFWDSWVAGLNGVIQSSPVEQWVSHGILAVVSHYLVAIVLMMLLLPAIYVTALAITAVFAMPIMVNHVAQKYFPDLERRHGGSTTGSIVNTMVAVVIYCVGWIISLPLWLFSPLAIVLPIILMAYLNQRLFRYDALAEHASQDEYEQVVEQSTIKLYLLGGLVGLVQFVPLLNLFSPVYVGLAFIHLCLAELDQLRHPAEGQPSGSA
jgi:CysZ protein